MSVTVTLTLSDEVARRVSDFAARTGRQAEDVLVEWIDQRSAAEDFSYFSPGTAYHAHAPQGSETAAQMLSDMLKAAEEANAQSDHDNTKSKS